VRSACGAEVPSAVTRLPSAWKPVLGSQLRQPYYHNLTDFLDGERRRFAVYPPERDVFSAFKLTAFDDARVVILGQDPYHGEGQAHGLAFSVRPGVTPPPSLRNIFKELQADVGCERPVSGNLKAWAEQGVLLINTVLTVRAHQPGSHRGKGWEQFTDAAITAVGEKRDPVVFVLWGAPARKKILLIDTSRHTIIMAPHPSPLSAKTGFFGSRPFTRVNAALKSAGRDPIDWCLPILS
jgi:uracil-DNA glycosylase